MSTDTVLLSHQYSWKVKTRKDTYSRWKILKTSKTAGVEGLDGAGHHCPFLGPRLSACLLQRGHLLLPLAKKLLFYSDKESKVMSKKPCNTPLYPDQSQWAPKTKKVGDTEDKSTCNTQRNGGTLPRKLAQVPLKTMVVFMSLRCSISIHGKSPFKKAQC